MLMFISHMLHILAACTSIGGLVYARLVIQPNLSGLPEAFKEALLKKFIARYRLLKWIGVTILGLTGLLQIAVIYPTVEQKKLYTLAFVLKMLFASGLLGITLSLALPHQRFHTIQRNRSFWAAMNICCAIGIVIMTVWMRTIRLNLYL